MSDRTDERVTTVGIAADHIARGCRARTSHDPSPYLRTIGEALASLAADAAETASLREETQTLRDLLREAECVIFEGVREDAPDVTGCESWYEVRLDSDEVRWRILDALGMKPIGYERFLTRIGAKEKAEAERDAAVADRDRLAEAAHDLNEYASNKAGYWQHPLTEKVRAYFDALAGREGSDDACICPVFKDVGLYPDLTCPVHGVRREGGSDDR